MSTTDAQYTRDLAKYNNEVAANKERSAQIQTLRAKNEELSRKKERLERAKRAIENENDDTSQMFRYLNSPPDTAQFKGTNEIQYWNHFREPLQHEIREFQNNIHRVEMKIVDQIRNIDMEIGVNESTIRSLTYAMTSPVMPTPPTN